MAWHNRYITCSDQGITDIHFDLTKNIPIPKESYIESLHTWLIYCATFNTIHSWLSVNQYFDTSHHPHIHQIVQDNIPSRTSQFFWFCFCFQSSSLSCNRPLAVGCFSAISTNPNRLQGGFPTSSDLTNRFTCFPSHPHKPSFIWTSFESVSILSLVFRRRIKWLDHSSR